MSDDYNEELNKENIYLEKEDYVLEKEDKYESDKNSYSPEKEDYEEEEETINCSEEIELNREQELEFRNFNLQIILADKNTENLNLKKNILLKEKEEVIKELTKYKIELAKQHNIEVDKYTIDLVNKKLIRKS